MSPPRRILGLLVALVFLSVGCGDDTPTEAGSSGQTASTTASATTVVPDFTDDYPCGYGFWTSDAAQTASLRIDYQDYVAAEAGEIARSSELTSGPWNAVIVIGTDLMANWCDDVIEEYEPVPEVTEEWAVTGGTIELSDPSPGQCGSAVKATVTGLIATTFEGVPVEFPALEITNEAWGCFTG